MNLRDQLSQGAVRVTFQKKNGDIRIMDCTTNLDLVPPSKWPKGKIEISEETKEETLRVFDLKSQEWRSFRLDKVIEVDTSNTTPVRQ